MKLMNFEDAEERLKEYCEEQGVDLDSLLSRASEHFALDEICSSFPFDQQTLDDLVMDDLLALEEELIYSQLEKKNW